MSRRTAVVALEPSSRSADEAEMAAAEAIGQLMQFWGFKRTMGRVWTLIYLSPEPVDAATLATRLKVSAGSMSMTLAELSRWGTIKKAWKPGDRRDYYEAETSIAKLVSRVLRERELRLVQEIRETLASALDALDGADARLSFKRDRLRRLWQLAKVGEGLLAALAAGRRIDPEPLTRVAGDPIDTEHAEP